MNGGKIATTLEDDHKVQNGGYDATPVRVDEGASFEMNGGELVNICDFTFAIDNSGTAKINGGKVSSVHTTVANYGTLEINGGEFTCNGLEGVTAHVVWASEGTVTINGGSFNGKDNYNGFNVDASEGATVYIKGGKFLNVHSGSLYGEGAIAVSGGIFFGYETVFEGNAFIGNKATNANGDALGNNVCVSTYYTDIDLSGNYWGGSAPVEGEDYFVQHKTYGYAVILNDYLTTYGE
jgi:hypothetical protein